MTVPPSGESRGRYCLVGAGAAGLATLAALRAQGIPVDCFERSDRVGGHWHTDYEALHLITPRDSSGFLDAPMPASYPLFPSRDQMRDYLTGYAQRHNLAEHVTFGCEVVEAVPVGSHAEDGWQVRTSDGRERSYDGLIVASGHLWKPRIPDVARNFTGRSLHSGEYRNSFDLVGPDVLVVGNGNSGCDIAVDAAQARFATRICARHGRIYQPKTLFGRPRSELPVVAKLPNPLRERVGRYLVRASMGQARDYGLPMPESPSLDKNLPVVNTLLPYWIHHGRIRVRTAITSIEGTKVAFDDGTVEHFDSIVWATGFDVSLPFLSGTALATTHGVPDRVAASVLPTGLARLYFVGMTAPRGPQLPAYSQQAELLLPLLRLQERTRGPLAAHHTFPASRSGELDVLRHLWEDDVRKTQMLLDTILAPSGESAGRSRR